MKYIHYNVLLLLFFNWIKRKAHFLDYKETGVRVEGKKGRFAWVIMETAG